MTMNIEQKLLTYLQVRKGIETITLQSLINTFREVSVKDLVKSLEQLNNNNIISIRETIEII